MLRQAVCNAVNLACDRCAISATKMASLVSSFVLLNFFGVLNPAVGFFRWLLLYCLLRNHSNLHFFLILAFFAKKMASSEFVACFA